MTQEPDIPPASEDADEKRNVYGEPTSGITGDDLLEGRYLIPDLDGAQQRAFLDAVGYPSDEDV